MKENFTIEELQSIRFALQYTYWLYRATTYKPEDLDKLQSKISRMIEDKQ